MHLGRWCVICPAGRTWDDEKWFASAWFNLYRGIQMFAIESWPHYNTRVLSFKLFRSKYCRSSAKWQCQRRQMNHDTDTCLAQDRHQGVFSGFSFPSDLTFRIWSFPAEQEVLPDDLDSWRSHPFSRTPVEALRHKQLINLGYHRILCTWHNMCVHAAEVWVWVSSNCVLVVANAVAAFGLGQNMMFVLWVCVRVCSG